MSWRGAVAFATALVALFVAGLWLGGHPGSLPDPLREAFVAEPGGLSAEAAEAIEDSYYRPVGGKELSNASLPPQRGPLQRILLAEGARKLQPEHRRAVLGDRRLDQTGQAGAGGGKSVPAHPRRGGWDRGGGNDRRGCRRADREAQRHPGDRKDQRAGRDAGGDRHPRQERQGATADPDPGRGRPPQRQQPGRKGGPARARLHPHAQLQRRGARPDRQGRAQGRARRGGGDRPRPAG